MTSHTDHAMQRALEQVKLEQKQKHEHEKNKKIVKEHTLELHHAVFNNDLDKLRRLLDEHRYDINSQDHYGNTPLILSVMLSHYDAAILLMDHDAQIKIRNKQGWNALSEAISIGNRQILDALWKRYKKRSTDEIKARAPELLKMFDSMGDFHLTITWKFSSWVPFVSRFLPSDTYHIWKHGRSIRCDTTLVDFDQMKWIRGDVSFLCSIVEKKDDPTKSTTTTSTTTQPTTTTTDATSTPTTSSDDDDDDRHKLELMLWDNDAKTYTRIGDDENEEDDTQDSSQKPDHEAVGENFEHNLQTEIKLALEQQQYEEELDGLMSNSISTITMPGRLQFTRAQSGLIPGWKKDKIQKIGKYEARVYNVSNINFQVTKRWEHMSPEEIAEAKKASNLLNDHKALQEKAREKVAESGASEEELEREEHEAKCIAKHEEDGEEGHSHRQSQSQTQGEQDKSKSHHTKEKSVNGTTIESDEPEHHASLPPPPPHGITEAQYFDEKNEYIHLGRPRIETTDVKTYKATAWMCDHFPLTTETVLTILEIVAPHHRHMAKLRDFVQNRLPEGFPIKIEMPVFPTITATIEFGDFAATKIGPIKFQIPKGYTQETMEQREARQQDPSNPNRHSSKKAGQGGLLD